MKSLEPADATAIRGWADSFKAAVQGDSSRWCESLAKIAAKKAEQIEQALTAKKQSNWKEMVGGRCDEDGRRSSPTALAYRWTKGLCGWISSPVTIDV